jgi:stage III sporulation protein AA
MGGMLLYSLPGAGKTSALRALCGEISRRALKKVVIVDERCEFIASDYSDATVDILQGYTKARGLEIALRTLSPDVIVVDEIGSFDEAESLLKVGRGGVPIIASAHAESYAELACKAGISSLSEEGYFSSFVHLFRKGGKFGYEIN